jgi:hypothetical protein
MRIQRVTAKKKGQKLQVKGENIELGFFSGKVGMMAKQHLHWLHR